MIEIITVVIPSEDEPRKALVSTELNLGGIYAWYHTGSRVWRVVENHPIKGLAGTNEPLAREIIMFIK